LEGLLSFSEPGLRTISALAARLRQAIVETLVDIASNVTKPFERRLAAAGIDTAELNKSWDSPFWPGVHALAGDEATPLAARWPVIMYAVKHDATLLEKFRPSLVDGSGSALQAAEIFYAAKNLDVAAEYFHKALLDARCFSVRFHILSRLAALGEARVSGRVAADSLDEYLQSKDDVEIDNVTIEKGLRLAETGLPKDEYFDLARNLASSARVESSGIRLALEVIADIAGESEVHLLLNERLGRCVCRRADDFSAFYETLYIHFLRAKFGEKKEAASALVALSRARHLSRIQRAHVCSWLANIGQTMAAKECLDDIFTEIKKPEDVLTLADIAFRIHDWSLARTQFRAVALNRSMKPSSRIEAAGGLGKVGLREVGRGVLSELNLANEDISLSLAALLFCEQEEEAVELCRNYSARSGVDFLDRVEAVGTLGNLYRKDLARSILLKITEKEKGDLVGLSRAAEFLNEFGYPSDARTILFNLREEALHSETLDLDEGLWLVETMISCNLHHSAKSVLDRIDKTQLTEDSLERYEEVVQTLEEPFLAD
jgi:hypothetical protein